MERLNTPGSGNISSGRRAAAERTIALFGSKPAGKKLASDPGKPGVYVIENMRELSELAAGERPESGRINSIIVITCPGDDVSMMPVIYDLAVKIKVLVTTIVVVKSSCRSHENTEQLGKLRATSDMVIITSDDSYLQCMLDYLD